MNETYSEVIKLPSQVPANVSVRKTNKIQSSQQLSKIDKYLQEIAQKDNDVKMSIQSIKKRLNITSTSFNNGEFDMSFPPQSLMMFQQKGCLNCNILKKRVESLKSMTGPIKDEMKILALQNSRLTRHNKKLQFKISQLQDQLTHRSKHSDQQQQHHRKIMIECKIKSLQNQSLIKQNKMLTADIQRLQHQIAQLNSNLQSITLSKEQLVNKHCSQLSALNSIISSSSNQFNQMQKLFQHKLTCKQAQMKAIEDKHRMVVEQMRKQLEEKLNVIELINKSLSNSLGNSEQLAAITERLRMKQKQCDGLIEQSQSLNTQLITLNNSNAYMTQLISNYQIQRSQQNQKSQQFQQQLQPQPQLQHTVLSVSNVTSIQQQLQSLKQQLQESQQQQDLYMQKFHQLQQSYLHKIHQLQDKLQQLQSFYQNQLNVNEGLKMNLKQHELQKAALSNQKSVLFYQTVNLTNEVQSLAGKLKNTQYEKEQTQKQVQRMTNQMKTLHSQLQQKQQQRQQLNGKILLVQRSANTIQRQYTLSISALQKQIVLKQQLIRQLQQQQQSLLEQKQRYIDQLKQSTQCRKWQDQIQELNKEISHLKEQIVKLTELIDQQRLQKQNQLQGYQNLHKQNQLIKEEMNRNLIQRDQLLNIRVFQLQQVTNKLILAQNQIVLAENQIGRLSQQTNYLSVLLSQTQQLNNKLLHQRQQHKLHQSTQQNKVLQFQNQIQSYQNEIARLKQSLELSLAEQSAHQNNSNNNQAEIEALRLLASQKSQQLKYQQQKQKELKQYQQQRQRLSSLLSKKQNQINYLTEKCAKLEAQEQQLNLSLTSIRKQLQQRQYSMRQVQKSNQSLIQQLDQMQLQLRQLNRLLSAQQLQYDSERFKYELNYNQLQQSMNQVTHRSKETINKLQHERESFVANQLTLNQQLQALQHTLQQTAQQSLRHLHYSQQKQQQLQQLTEQLQQKDKIIQLLQTRYEQEINTIKANFKMNMQEEQIIRLEERFQMKQRENHSLHEDNSKLHQDNANLQQDNAKQFEENKGLLIKIEELTNKLQQSMNSNNKLQQQLKLHVLASNHDYQQQEIIHSQAQQEEPQLYTYDYNLTTQSKPLVPVQIHQSIHQNNNPIITNQQFHHQSALTPLEQYHYDREQAIMQLSISIGEKDVLTPKQQQANNVPIQFKLSPQEYIPLPNQFTPTQEYLLLKQAHLQQLQNELTERLLNLQQREAILLEKQQAKSDANEFSLQEYLVNAKNNLAMIEKKSLIIQKIKQKKNKKATITINNDERVIIPEDKTPCQQLKSLQQQQNGAKAFQSLKLDLQNLQHKISNFQYNIKTQKQQYLPHLNLHLQKKQRSVIDILDEMNLQEEEMKQSQSLSHHQEYIIKSQINIIPPSNITQVNMHKLRCFDEIESFFIGRLQNIRGDIRQGINNVLIMMLDALKLSKQVLVAKSQHEIITLLQKMKQTISNLFTLLQHIQQKRIQQQHISQSSSIHHPPYPSIPPTQLSPIQKSSDYFNQQQHNFLNYSAQFKKKKSSSSILKIKQEYSEIYSQRKPPIEKSQQQEEQCYRSENNHQQFIIQAVDHQHQKNKQQQQQKYFNEIIQTRRKTKQKSILLIEDINQAVSVDEQESYIVEKNGSLKQFSLNESAESIKFGNMPSLISDNNKEIQDSFDSKPSLKSSLKSNKQSFQHLSEIPNLMRSEQSSLNRKQQQDRYKTNMKNMKTLQKLKNKKKR